MSRNFRCPFAIGFPSACRFDPRHGRDGFLGCKDVSLRQLDAEPPEVQQVVEEFLVFQREIAVTAGEAAFRQSSALPAQIPREEGFHPVESGIDHLACRSIEDDGLRQVVVRRVPADGLDDGRTRRCPHQENFLRVGKQFCEMGAFQAMTAGESDQAGVLRNDGETPGGPLQVDERAGLLDALAERPGLVGLDLCEPLAEAQPPVDRLQRRLDRDPFEGDQPVHRNQGIGYRVSGIGYRVQKWFLNP